MSKSMENDVRSALEAVQVTTDKTGPAVVDTLCKLVVRLGREIDELRAAVGDGA